MNLNENISRIKELLGLSEGVENDEFEISYRVSPKVKELQKFLIDKGYYIGKFGENKDGIDGKYGPLTKAAHTAFKNNISPENFESFGKTMAKTIKQDQMGDKVSTGKKNIIIGDSQTPYVAMNTSKASLISKKPGVSSLWEGGKTVSWLINALNQFQTSPEVSNVIIVIGTNGGFGKFLSDDIGTLFSLLRTKFPNAKFYVVQGSWGWGGLKNITRSDVRKYYQRFAEQGATIIEPPIGPIEPHGNKPIYKEIGAAIDSFL